jgi:hypothetical protein
MPDPVETTAKDLDAQVFASLTKFEAEAYDLSKSSVERSRTAAATVQSASAALVAVYTGVLALAFSVTDNPLPLRGLLAPIFLGAAVVFSTAYVAYIVPRLRAFPVPSPEGSPDKVSLDRLQVYADMASDIVSRRSWTMRAAVVSLGVGLAYMALPFIGNDPSPADDAAPPASAVPVAAVAVNKQDGRALGHTSQDKPKHRPDKPGRPDHPGRPDNPGQPDRSETGADDASGTDTTDIVVFVLLLLLGAGVVAAGAAVDLPERRSRGSSPRS